jgi:hypothetical protein
MHTPRVVRGVKRSSHARESFVGSNGVRVRDLFIAMESFADVNALLAGNIRGTDWARGNLEPVEPKGMFRYIAPRTVNPPKTERNPGEAPVVRGLETKTPLPQSRPVPRRPPPSASSTDFSAVERLLAESAPAPSMPTLRQAVTRKPAAKPKSPDMDDDYESVTVEDVKHNAAGAPRNHEEAPQDMDGDTEMEPVGPARVVDSQWTGCSDESPCGSGECERCGSDI